MEYPYMDDIHHELTVACGPREAFELFTTGMGTWWDPAYTPDAATFSGIDVGPEVGGEVAMLLGPERFVFGRVTAWEPGRHYAQSFWLAMDPAYPSSLDVAFAPIDGVCTLHFNHGGWNVDNARSRSRYGDWSLLLGRFAEAAARLV